MAETQPRTLTYVAAFVLVILIVTGLWEARRRGRFRKTEAQLVAEIKAVTEAPTLAQGADEFPQDRWDPQLHSQLARVAARLHPGITDCIERSWPNAPLTAKVRITADPAGRLMTVSIQGASDAAEECLATVLARGQYPRKTDGVADLVLSYR